MPNASSAMVATLTKDLAALEPKIAKIESYVAENKKSAFAKLIPPLREKFKTAKTLNDAWVKKLAQKPPVFPEDKPYADARKALTKLISDVDGLDKKAMAEKKIYDAAVRVKVDKGAVGEVVIKNAKMAQALTAVATGVSGRTSPKMEGLDPINHIHIGGNAGWNLIFNPSKKLVLGTVDFHMDSTMNKQQKAEAKAVSKRSGTVVTVVILNKTDIAEES